MLHLITAWALASDIDAIVLDRVTTLMSGFALESPKASFDEG
jgi:hypothetical protein